MKAQITYGKRSRTGNSDILLNGVKVGCLSAYSAGGDTYKAAEVYMYTATLYLPEGAVEEEFEVEATASAALAQAKRWIKASLEVLVVA